MNLGNLISDKKLIPLDDKKYLVIEYDPDNYGDDKPHPHIMAGRMVRYTYFTKKGMEQNALSDQAKVYIYPIND